MTTFYLRHKKLFTSAVVLCFAAALYFWPETAYAQEGEKPIGSTMKDINDAFDVILRVSAAWMWPVILMIGSLLDNDLIFGGAMGERLLGIWVQIRNLVNIVFVLVLIAIAIYNVLPGVGEEGGGLQLGLKTALPKFILALIAVNFSFLAVKVVLDFTNVLTGAVFALPTTAVDQPADLKDTMKQTICGTASEEMPMRALWCDKFELNERAEAFFSKLDRSNITLAYAIRFGRAPNLKFVKGGLKDVTQLGFNIIFNAVLYVVYAVSYIVLFLVLLMRVVVLWIAVVLSPLLALGIVLPNFKDLAGGAGNLKETFVANALAPVRVGLVLSIGYIMLDGFGADKTIHAEILAGSTLTAADPNSVPTDINDLQQLLIAIGTVVILWKGVFDATDKTAASFVTNFIKGHMESFGKWVAKLPTYAQIIPVGGGKRSVAQVFDTLAYKKQKWTEEHAYAPERKGINTIRDASTAPQLAEGIRANLGTLVNTEGLRMFEQKARDLKDKDLADAIKTLNGTEEQFPQQFADRVFANHGPVAKALQEKFSTREELRDALKREKAAPPPPIAQPPGAPAAAAPAAVPAAAPAISTPQQAWEVLKGTKTSTDLAAAEFAGWDVGLITEFRSKNFADNIATALLKVDASGKVQPLNPTLLTSVSQLRDSLKSDEGARSLTPAISDAIAKARTSGIDEGIITAVVGATLRDDAVKASIRSTAPPSVPAPR